MEGIQGIGGVHKPSNSYWQLAKKLCKSVGALLIADEIQSGCGRSGEFFAYQSSKVDADVITMAKGLGNGFPVGGILVSPEIELAMGSLGTTFGGNPLACRAALEVVKAIESEDLCLNAQTKGQQ